MGRFIHTDKWQEPSAAEVFNQRQNVARLGQQAFQQSQKNTNDTVGNTAFGHLVDAAQANAAGLFAGQLRAVDEGLNWAGEKLGLAEKTGTRDKSGWLEQAAQAMDEVQRRNTAQEELTGLNYLAQQVGSVLGSMAAMTAETVALGGGLSLAGKGVGALARLAGIASKTNAGANVNNIIGASGNLTSKAIGAARKMWGGNYLQNYYKLQMMNSPAEALGQAGNLLKQLEDEGYDRDTIRAAALWSGTLNAAFLPLANMAEGKLASMGANMIAKNIVGKEAAKAAMVPTMLGLKATLGKAAGTSAWQGLTEGGEEGVQDYIDQFSTQAAQGKDFKDMEWDHATAAKSFIDAGVGSAALGFLGGATNYRSRAKNFNANGHNFQLSDDGRTWSVDGKDRIMKPDFNEDGTPAIDKETNKQTESLQPYTAKEIADLMGNDVTEADVRGAMRAEKAKTSKVSSGDARPVAVKPDAKKEETKQQPVPGFTVLEDDSGNAIYTDNISGVEYNSKDGWVVPANDNTDGKQLYNTNTGNFANANTQRVLPNGDTVDVVSGEVTKKENEVKNTQEDTTVPKKENVITPPVEPAPVAARQFTPFNGVGYRRARPKGEIVYDEDIYVDTNDDSGWRQLPNGTWENTITGEKSESKPEKIVNTTVGDETVGDDNPPASNENKPQPSYVGKKITYTSENRTAVDRKKKTVDNLLNAGFITKKVHDGVIHALDTNKHARDKKTKLARIIESVSKKPFTMPSNDVIASKLEEIKLQKQKEEKKNGKGSKQNSKPKQAEVKVAEDVNQSKPEVGKGREEAQEVIKNPDEFGMSKDDFSDFTTNVLPSRVLTSKKIKDIEAERTEELQDITDDDTELIDAINKDYQNIIDEEVKKQTESKIEQLQSKKKFAGQDAITVESLVKRLARNAIDSGNKQTARDMLKSYSSGAVYYYDYLIDKYSPKDTAETTKVVAEQAPVVNQEQAEEVAAPAEVAVETKAPVDPEAQARDLSKNNKTTKGRKALLYSFINGSLRKVELMFNLNKNSLAFPEASLVALRDEFNKNKYFDKVKVRREEGMNDVEEFLRAVDSVDDKLLEQVKLEDGRTMKDLLYAFKENTSAEIEKLVSYKADEQAIMDKAQEEMSGLAENDPKRAKIVKAAEKKIDSMRKKQIAEQEKLLGKDASSNPLQGLKLSLQKSAYKALKNVVAPNSTLEERVDLLDAALVGIMKAARKYKPFMGADVATYAMPFIKNEMIKRLQEKTGVNSAEYKLAQELDKAVAQLTEEKLDVTDEALAQRMNDNNSDNDKYTPVTAEDLKEIRKTQLKLQGTRSFSESVTDDGSVELGDTIPDKDAQAAFDAIDNDDTNRASIVQATQQDTEMRDRIITPENEKKVVAQLQKLFGGYDMKEVSPHKYEIKLPNGNSLQIDMSKTSAQLIDKLGNKVGELADIADVQGNVAVAGLYSAEDGINLIRLTDAVRNGTVPHEVAHFVFNAVFNETERRKLLDYYKSKITDKTGLTEEQLNRRAEEMFCDDFAEYFLKDKSEPKSKLQRMFEKMKRFLRKLVDMFSFKDHPYTEEELDLRRDDVDVNAESLAALYGRMVNGDIYNREFNKETQADILVAQTLKIYAKQAEEIRKQYEGSDKWLKAPNGKDTNLSPELWCLVRTPNFKRWGGDWEDNPKTCSVILDDNGEPKILYHGTNHIFESFDTDSNRFIYATDSRYAADGYLTESLYPIPSSGSDDGSKTAEEVYKNKLNKLNNLSFNNDGELLTRSYLSNETIDLLLKKHGEKLFVENQGMTPRILGLFGLKGANPLIVDFNGSQFNNKEDIASAVLNNPEFKAEIAAQLSYYRRNQTNSQRSKKINELFTKLSAIEKNEASVFERLEINDIAILAKEMGYTSFIAENVKDAGMGTNGDAAMYASYDDGYSYSRQSEAEAAFDRPITDYIFFSPYDVKSVGNNGDFGVGNPKFRAQLVSVPQASNVAETKALVEKAKEMYANGATDNEVWQATGCKRYNDGTIKLYVPFTEQDIISNGISEDFIPQRDADVVNGKIENPFPELIDSKNISVKQSVSVKLSDMLSPDNIFFKMIPSLKDTTVRYVVPTGKVARALGEGAGLYDVGTNTITLVVNSISPGGKITFSEGKTLAHELQHAIQQADNGVARDNALGVLYSNAYDVDPMENEARYAETTYKNESLAKGDDELLTSRRENYGTFTAKVYSIVRDMKNNPIIRNKVPGLIARTQKILMSMAGAYGNGTAALPNGSAYGGALREPFVNLYNYAKNKASVEQLNNLRDIMDRVTELSRDFNARQVELLRKGKPMSMPNNEYLGEDTQGRLEAAKGMFSGSNITEDADGKVRVTFDDVPTLDGKPTTDEIGGAIVNADNKVLRKLRKGDTTIKDDVKPKDPIVFDPNATGDENNKFSLLDWLRSPSRLAKKFRKVFEFFAKTFDTAYRAQNQLRYEWHNMLKEATEFLSDSVENFNLFNDLMLYGDTYGRYNDKGEYENTGIDFDANQLNGMIYYTDADGKKVFVPSDQQFIPEGVETHQLPENVAKAYLKVRELTETIYAAVDRARRSGLIKTEKANLQRILQINDPKNRAEGYVEIKGSDGQYHSLDEFRQYLNDKDTYDIRYAKIRVIDQKAAEVNITENRLKEIENDDTLELHTQTHTPKANGLYDVVYTKYMPHMGHRRGHVPHIFERWMVAYVNDDGSYTIQDSQKTVNAARESITKFQEQDADNNVQRQYVIFPKAFDFGSFNGADEVTGGGALATQKQKQEMYVNLIKNYMMTPEEANRAVNAAMRTSVKNRIYGQAVKRKGVAGYSKDVMDALIREVTSASRYCALQPAKHAAIDRYEHLFNMNYNADIKVGDNPLQAMVKSYIDDCNGKPSKAEQLLNRTLNNWDFWRNNISATYGDRAILQAASVANQITSMAKLGFWNISSAVVNLFQNMNTIALCGFGHFGEGVKAFRDLKFKDKDKLTGKELADYLLNEQIIEQTGVKYDIGMDSATGYSMRLERLKNNTDVGTPKGLLQVIYDNYMRIGDKGLALFSGAEAANRQICVLTAYRDGIAKGMTHDEAIEYAREVNKKANFDYGVADTPAFMRAMSGTGVGEMMMLFQKYPVKELELMCEMCKKAMSNTDGDKAQAARFWGMYFLMSGIGGIPFLDGFDEWLEHLFGYKPSKRAKLELIDTFGDNAFTRSVCYGVGATAGIDISQRVGMGDLKFGNSQLMFPFNFGGAAGSTLKQMIEAAMEGDPVHIAKAFSPSIGAVLEAGQGYSTDKKGRLRTLYSVPQMFVRSTGFRPIEDSVNADLNTALTEQRSDDRNEKSKFKYQIALKQTQGQPLTADDQRKLRTMNISGKQLADARKQIKQSFAKRAKELMSKEQRQRYGSVYEDFEREEDDI